MLRCALPLFLLLGAALAVPRGNAAAGGPFPERKTFQFGRFFIEASAGDEALVEALALQLGEARPPADVRQNSAGTLTTDDLAGRRDHFLGEAARWIGLDNPTPKMGEVYDLVLELWRIAPAMLPRTPPHRYALWHRAELVARLQAGERIPGFQLEAGRPTFSFEVNFHPSPGGKDDLGRQVQAAVTDLVCPLKIPEDPGLPPQAAMRAALEQGLGTFFDGFRSAMETAGRSSVFNVLHETIEAGIVWHYLHSRDRRWFCDGLANYLALRIIAAEVGEKEAKRYYDLSGELEKYRGLAGRIDLTAWPAAENQGGFAEEVNTADYAFATKAIADIAARYGDDFFPKLFGQIGKVPADKADMTTVAKAFHRLTGDDLRKYLPKVRK